MSERRSPAVEDVAAGALSPRDSPADAEHQTDGPADQLDLTIAWLVQNREASVRLVNCVAANPSIGEISLRQFLADPPNTERLLLGIKSLGRKTADELSALVEATAVETPQCRSPHARIAEPDQTTAFRVLINILSPIPFPAALLTIEISMRLRNCLKAIESSRLTRGNQEGDPTDLGALLAGWTDYRRKLAKQANLGKTTIGELAGIIETIVRTKLNACCGSADAVPAIDIDDLTEQRLSPSIVGMLLKMQSQTGETASSSDQPDISVLLHGSDPGASLSPSEHVRSVVLRLQKKECDVILRRYGLDGKPRETLEQVATQFHVTREAVRQVQEKALARLRVGANRRALERLLKAEQENVWDLLSGGSDLLLPADLQDQRPMITAEYLLAIEVVHGRLADWAASFGHACLGGWLRGDADEEEIRRSARQLADWAANVPGPIPVESAAKGIGLSGGKLAHALKLRPDVRIFEGYLCPGHPGSQARRTCRLHEIARKFGDCMPFDIATLCRKYASEHPEDDVSKRVIHVQLQRAPHLFFKLFDGMWVAIGSGAPSGWDRAIESMPFETAPAESEADFEAGSIGAWLHAALASGGPARVVDLRAQAETGISQKISQSSVGAILQSNPDFVRMAPGVYGLQRHMSALSDPLSEVIPAMMSDAQCRYYATSRHAGDPITLYPAWNYRLEAALCHWASTNGSDDNYRSMLAVSDPSKWCLEPEEKSIWHERKRVHGSFRLPRLDPPHNLRLPPAAAFLSATLYLCMTGSIAWTTVNRTAQRRIDDQKAASTLALLVRFGMTVPPDKWQARHICSPRAAVVVSRVIADLAETGVLSWDEGTLASLRREPPTTLTKLFDADQVEAMLAGGDDSADSRRMMDGGKPADLESLFGSEEWGAAFLSEKE